MLTAKQEAFAQAVASGKNQSDAYRSAFSVKPTTKPETVQANASRLMANSMVSARVAELKEALAKKALWTREMSVKVLAKIAVSQEEGSSAKVSAVKELNLMHGYNAPVEMNVTTRTLEPLTDEDFLG